MDLRALRYFVATAEELNITRAAEKLHMSQPPLSHQLRLLEEELGAPLFLRGHRRLQLTPEGELLLRRARQLLELEEKTRGEIRQVQQSLSGRLFLGMVEGRAPYLAAGWIAGFRQAHPAVSYSLWNGSSDVADRLDKGLSDLGIVASPYNTEQLRGLVVGQEPWAAILPRDHPLARDPSPQIPLASLVGVPLIVPSLRSRMEAIRQWFAQIGKEPLFLCDTSNYLDAVALTEQGAGVSIFPQTTLTPNQLVVSKVIVDPPRRAEYVLVWSRRHRPGPLAGEFIRYVQSLAPEPIPLPQAPLLEAEKRPRLWSKPEARSFLFHSIPGNLFVPHPAAAGLPDGPAFFQAGRQIQDPLVAAAPEAQVQAELVLLKAAVHQDIQAAQQLLLFGSAFFHQLLKGVAGVAGHLIALCPEQPGQTGKFPGLAEGLAPGKGHPFYQRVLLHKGEDILRLEGASPLKGPGGFVLAARTVMGAALAEHGEPDAGAVHNAVLHDPRKHQHSGIPHICLTRSRSSAFLASFHLSMVPTR